MKNLHNYLSLLCLAFVFSSCQSLYFAEPQPKGSPKLLEIPTHLHGNYIALGEDGLMEHYYHVNKDGFDIYNKTTEKISIDSVSKREDIYLKDSLIYIKSFAGDLGLSFTMEQDSLIFSYYTREQNLLGKELAFTEDKRHLYMNVYSSGDEGWECSQLEILRNGDLVVWGIEVKKEEMSLRKYLQAKPERDGKDADWTADPSKRKFRKYVKQGGFRNMSAILHKLDDSDLPDLYLAFTEKNK